MGKYGSVGPCLASLNFIRMKILRVVGLGILIIMLKFLVPRIFAGFESTLLALFDSMQSILGTAKSAAQIGSITPK